MSTGTEILHLTEKNFEEEIGRSGHPILVDFWAEWCGPCHQVAPILKELAAEYAGRARIGKVNVDENTALASRYGVQSIPTLILFKEGQVLEQAVGALPKRNLQKLIDAHI